jgi:hypothetical protein
MKKFFAFALVLALALSVFGGVSTASASARTASWVVSITYQNVGTDPTSVEVDFYAEDSSSAITFCPLAPTCAEKDQAQYQLADGAGASFFIGRVGDINEGFRGNAVMKSQQPLVATVVQFSQDAGFKMRLLSNAFQADDGSTQYLVATTLLEKFDRTTVFSIQNTQASDVTATVNFYDADNNGALASSIDHDIKGNSSKYIEMDNTADTGLSAGTTVFNGSAIVTVPEGSAVVAAASELYTDINVAANFEGLPLANTGQTMYMATGLCRSFSLDTFYAVQNASLTTDTEITVTYRDKDGNEVATDGPYDVNRGGKKSIRTCDPSDGTDMTGFTGSAVIESDTTDIAVIGKAQCSVPLDQYCQVDKVDVFTAFLGEPQGYSKIAMPFIRWGSDARFNDPANNGGVQRSFIAIQNLESNQIKVDLKYYDKNGGLANTHTLTIPGLSKGNSNADLANALGFGSMNPGEFGYYTDGSFGGSVIAEAHTDNPNAKFIAVVRVQNPGAGEDYNAVFAP